MSSQPSQGSAPPPAYLPPSPGQQYDANGHHLTQQASAPAQTYYAQNYVPNQPPNPNYLPHAQSPANSPYHLDPSHAATHYQAPPALPPRYSYGSVKPTQQNQPPPAPSQDDLRQRLEAAGVSPEQIAQILQQPVRPPPQPIPQSPSQKYTNHAPQASLDTDLQKLSISSQSELSPYRPTKADYEHPNYPFNLPKSAPIVLEIHDFSDDGLYLVPPKCTTATRLYTKHNESPTQRYRADLVVKHHKQRNPKSERWAGSCDYLSKSIWPRFPWMNWGEWKPQANTEAFMWKSDVGTQHKDTVLYWTKSVDKEDTGFLLLFTCRAKPAGFDWDKDLFLPSDEDPILCKIEMAGPRGGVITISPGIIKKQEQLDEMIVLALGLQNKYCYDIACWLAMEKGWKGKDFETATEISFVPHNINGWFDQDFNDSKPAAKSSGDKSAKWKERGKIFAGVVKLGHSMASLGNSISQAQNGQQGMQGMQAMQMPQMQMQMPGFQ